jgi:hypothetical protein
VGEREEERDGSTWSEFRQDSWDQGSKEGGVKGDVEPGWDGGLSEVESETTVTPFGECKGVEERGREEDLKVIR